MRVHFISIGGSVMHQLAIALSKKSYQVSGSDDEIFEPAAGNLAAANLLPAQIGWNPQLITANLDAVILGMHAKDDNPELLKAKELGLAIYSFPEYIFQESKEKLRIVVGGSHGKTTTTSMIMHALQYLNKSFDYLVGAKLAGFEQSVSITNAPTIVCEGDEYPASAIERKPKFHFLYPHIAILTGIAWDHINVFPTFEFYLEQFVIFINRIEPGGLLIYNQSDEKLNKLVNDHLRADIRYQPYEVPKHEIVSGVTTVQIGNASGKLLVFGNHNLMNLQAAYYACAQLNIEAADFVKAMANFTGASKRLELLASSENINVYRDFAHAPSKVKASVEAVKQQYPTRKLFAILELHTYSSLNEAFMTEYKNVFDLVDYGVVFYSKHALELKRMPFLSPEKVKAGFAKEGLIVINERDQLEQWMHVQDFTNANILLMSSGNYDGINIFSFAKAITH
ncbi:MAG: Mur ligase family protein [Sediminibacterium sp.]|nr:Mur ligase family protein [Sediminibacterium sp.]TXT34140.1 MAG: UDP-N-acetylmuramate: L-alanyl-gamma-D-glutamyl-meso-diaminopimelate ligase [Chitinophagaceae bacterium]